MFNRGFLGCQVLGYLFVWYNEIMNPENLFLNVWAQIMGRETAIMPGSAEWSNQRPEMLKYWAHVWLDCVELSNHVGACTTLASEACETTRPPVE